LYLTPGLRPGLRAQSLLRSSHYTGNASDIRLCRSFPRYLGHYQGKGQWLGVCRRLSLTDHRSSGWYTIGFWRALLCSIARGGLMQRRLVIFLCCCSLAGIAQNKRPFTFEDMMQLKRIGEPVVSPDSKWVAFSAVDVDLEKNTKTPHLWIVPIAGGEARRLTPDSGKGEDRIRFAPDGKHVLFESAREGGSQIWVQEFDTSSGTLTGEPRRVTNISTEASGAIWSPDGKSILFVSSVYPDCNDDACNKQRDDEKAKSKVQAHIFTQLMFRHWTSYFDGKYSHLFLVSADGGVARDLTPGAHDVPPFSLGGQDQYSFSPDGKEIAYTSNIDEVQATSTNSDIFIVPVGGPIAAGIPKKITTNPGSDSTPLYSPDGKYIAYRSQLRGGYESDRFRLMLYERATGKIIDAMPNFDRWVDSMAWSPNSQAIYYTAENEGDAPIYIVNTTRPSPLPLELVAGFNDSPMPTPDGKTLVFDRMSVMEPNEIYTASLGERGCTNGTTELKTVYKLPVCLLAKAQPLTKLNDPVLSQVQMQPLEPYWFEGANKDKVQGFVVKPPNFDPNKKYPVKYLIHGGPEGAWGDDWSYRWNPELFAANGYVVVMVNFHGSTGYGQKFIDAINGDWGGAPYQDLMAGLDYAEQHYPFIDKDRECALGASYGGYAINWIEGHTNRFKCLVSHDGMFNTESAYGTTEELWFNEWEFKGTPWTNREMYRKWSPHLFATNFKTPILVVHGQLDYRLDVSEGFQMFTTAQRLKIPSKMLYFPDEGHWVLKPQNSRLWYQTVNGWVDQWTK
jgi:dipeptidyl aminopeptidase/acylaminoacyl peptidase